MMPEVTASAAPAEIAVEMLFPGRVDKDISQKSLYIMQVKIVKFYKMII